LKVTRFTLRASLVTFWILCGLLIIALTYPWIGLSGRLWAKKYWSKVLLALCGVRVRQQGAPVLQGGVLWVVNHISWLDIFVLNCVRATAFVAKSEIRHWPLIGWLAAGAGTIFIERASRHAVHKVGHAMQAHFAREQAVGLFPEGTTSSGFDLLPFYANLFEPARKAAVQIQPVALLYFHQGQRSDLAAFVGEQTLVESLWCVLSASGLSIEIHFLPTLLEAGAESPPPRVALSRLAREAIATVVLKQT
jgi:1-acyl-sn-glycerol-3-phosphate acyltransferase